MFPEGKTKDFPTASQLNCYGKAVFPFVKLTPSAPRPHFISGCLSKLRTRCQVLIITRRNRHPHVPNVFYTISRYKPEGVKKASQYQGSVTANTSSRSPQRRQLGWGKERRLRKEEGCQKGPTKPGLSSLTQMEREALAPIADRSGASEDTITFLPLAKPRRLAKATCGHRAGPLQLT